MKTSDPFSKFKIDRGEYCMNRLPSLILRAIELLKSYPNNKLSMMGTIAGMLGVTKSTLSQHVSHPALSVYRTNALKGRGLLWGNASTIKEFNALKRKQMEATDDD